MDQVQMEVAQKFELDNLQNLFVVEITWRCPPLIQARAEQARAAAKEVSPHLIAWASSILRERLKKGHKSSQMAFFMISLESNGQAATSSDLPVFWKKGSALSLRDAQGFHSEKRATIVHQRCFNIKDGALLQVPGLCSIGSHKCLC